MRKLLAGQEREVCIWRDASTQYFANFSKMPLPADVEAPACKLDELRALAAPFAAADKCKASRDRVLRPPESS